MPQFPLMREEDIALLERVENVTRGLAAAVQDSMGPNDELLLILNTPPQFRARRSPRPKDKTPKDELVLILSDLRDEMTRDRLSVGLIGPSQVGKSATMPNLLKVDEAQSPTPTGGLGTACTSAITRVRPVPLDSPRTVTLHYMNAEEFRNRLNAIRGIEKLRLPPDLEGGELIAECKRRLASQEAIGPEILELIIRLVEAGRAHHSILTNPTIEVGDFDRRSDYVKHSARPTKYSLLREVVIEFPTDQVDHRLEFIDLPGLGTSFQADDLLTESVIGELDSVFIFQSAIKQLNDASVAKLLDSLRDVHGSRLGLRTWLVTSGFDNLARIGMAGNDEGETVLHTIETFMKRRNVEPRRALLTGNHIFQALLANAKENGLADLPPVTRGLVDWAIDRKLNIDVKFEWDPHGNPVVPEQFKSCKSMVQAYEEVLKDGGIGRFHRTINQEVGDAVQEEVQRDVTERLKRLKKRLRDRIEGIKESGSMRPEDTAEASEWSADIGRLVIHPLGSDPSIYEKETERLQTRLKEYLTRVVIEDLPMDSAETLHRGYCGNLTRLAIVHAVQEAESIYTNAEKLMDAVASKRKLLTTGIPEHRDPRRWWLSKINPDREKARDRPDKAWYAAVFHEFNVPELQFGGDADSIPASDYKHLMNRKIDLIVYRFVNNVLARLIASLQPIREALHTLGAVGGLSGHADDGELDRLLGELDKE